MHNPYCRPPSGMYAKAKQLVPEGHVPPPSHTQPPKPSVGRDPPPVLVQPVA
jgi:hypothetical protein